MTLRHLKIFITVADCGSMTGAAERLFVAQPTISQAVLELEQHYGVRLFDRLSRKLHITEKGRQLLGYARHSVAIFDEMEAAVKNPESSGILRIGASVTIGTRLLPGWLRQFSSQYPQLQVQGVVKNTREIEGLIARNAIDFGIVEGAVHNRDFEVIPFMEDELVLACGRTHPLYGVEVVSARDVEAMALILREQGSGTRELFESVMTAKEIRVEPVWECNDSDAIKGLAICGSGVAVLSRRLIEPELENGELAAVPIQGVQFRRSFCLVHHKNKYLTEAIRGFMAVCRPAL